MHVLRKLAMVILSVGLAVVVILLLVWQQQERIAFQPPMPPFDDAGATPRVTYLAADGAELFAFVVGDTVKAQRVVIAFHGNADLAVWQIPWAQELSRRTGSTVMLAEYRGYGGTAGRPTYGNAQLDARAAFQYATDNLDASSHRMVFFGHSLGSAIATELAAEHPPAALALQSPFTSARDMARIIVARPIALAWNAISRIHYDTEARVAKLSVPVHVAHGDRDLVVPVRMGRRVYAAAKMKGQLLIVNGAGHNNIEDRGGDRYWDWLTAAVTGVPVDR